MTILARKGASKGLGVTVVCPRGTEARGVLRLQEVRRGLTFEYCLIAAGTTFNRAPSDQRLEAGDILCLDSGGNYKGYIGDLCRMAILGEPDSELVDLLGGFIKLEDTVAVTEEGCEGFGDEGRGWKPGKTTLGGWAEFGLGPAR